LQARRQAIEEMLAGALDSVLKNQLALLELERRQLAMLEDRFKQVVSRQLADKKKTMDYIEAKTRYLQAKKIFEAAQIKYSTMLIERAR
jgi:hypothetical protein